MKIFTKMLPALFLALGTISLTVAQEQSRHDLGTAETLRNSLRKRADIDGAGGGTLGTVNVEVAPGKTLDIALNVERSDGPNSTTYIGTVANEANSVFTLEIDEETVTGSITFGYDKESTAYTYASDASGRAYVEPTPIDEIVCVGYTAAPGDIKEVPTTKTPRAVGEKVISLESLPGAETCIYLDFDGEVVEGTLWEGGRRIDAAPADASDEDIEIFWARVTEDFEAFDVNVTTDLAVFESYPSSKSMQCIVTETNFVAPGVVGVAYLNSFTDDLVCWVFDAQARASLAASHEVGHTIGLSHDGRTPDEDYYGGTSLWGPIMGNPFGSKITHWSKGDYGRANNLEDDYEIITSRFIPYRADDHGNGRGSATALTVNDNGSIDAVEGFIGKPSDLDFFSFSTGGGDITLNVDVAPYAPSLNTSVSLYRADGNLVGKFNGGDNLATRVETELTAGDYYFSIDGIGYKDPYKDGYSDYGSLGFFKVSGKIAPGDGGGGGDDCDVAGGTIDGGPYEFTIDGEPDFVTGLSLEGESGPNSAWVITDEDANILDLVGTKADVEAIDFDGASAGVCLIWHISFEDGLQNAEVGRNASELEGCFELSNSISVTRIEDGGDDGSNQAPTVAIDDPVDGATFEVGDDVRVGVNASDADGTVVQVDLLIDGEIRATSESAPIAWVISGITEGTYVFAAIATDDDGASTTSADVTITVGEGDGGGGGGDDCDVAGGTIDGGPYEFTIDGEPDFVTGLSLEGESGPNSAWVITDEDANIIGVVATKADVEAIDFEDAGVGVSLIWHISFEDGLQNAEAGRNASELEGCFELSNSISVTRTRDGGDDGSNQAPTVAIDDPVDGATFEVGDDVRVGVNASDADGTVVRVDLLIDGEIRATSESAPIAWVISGITEGTYVFAAIATDDDGASTTSADVTITVGEGDGGGGGGDDCDVAGGTIDGGPYEFTIDGEPDFVTGLSLEGESGPNSAWVITDEDANILDLVGTKADVEAIDFDGASAGVCLIWHISFEDGLQNAEVGRNASELEGCFELSNSISVTRIEDDGDDDGIATIYEDCNFEGQSVALTEGLYSRRDLAKLGFRDNSLSSIKVADGYQAILYSWGYFRGHTVLATADDPCLVDDRFNDVTSSIIIRRDDSTGNQIEAEDYTWARGVAEPVAVNDGGQAISLRAGNWLAFDEVTFPVTSDYVVEYRVSSAVEGSELSLSLNRGRHRLGRVAIPNTGSVDSYTTVTDTVRACAGTYVLGLYASYGKMNVDWVRVTPIEQEKGALAARSDDWDPESAPLFGDEEAINISVFPNPVAYDLQVEVPEQLRDSELSIIDQRGAVLWTGPYQDRIDVSSYPTGAYGLLIKRGSFQTVKRFIKQ